MNHSEAIIVIDELLPKIASAQDAASVLTGYAGENNLAPEQLRKLGHVYNTLLAVSHLDRAEDRASEHPVLDVAGMVEKYASFAPKVSERPVDRMPASDFKIVVKRALSLDEAWGIQEVKTASAAASPRWDGRLSEKQAAANELLERLVSGYRELERSFDKLARDLGEQDALLLGEDVLMTQDPGLQSYYDRLMAEAARHHRYEKRASGPGPRRLNTDRTGYIAALRGVRELEQQLTKEAATLSDTDYSKLIDVISGQNAPADDVNGGGGPPTGRKARIPDSQSSFSGSAFTNVGKDPSPKETEDRPVSLSNTVDDLSRDLNVAPFFRSRALDLLPKVNVPQRSHDTAMLREKTHLNLTRLLIADPVIATRDPKEMVSYAQTLIAQDPSLGADYNRLRWALREALEYQGVSEDKVRALLEVRKNRAQGEQSEADITKSRYAQSLKLTDEKKSKE